MVIERKKSSESITSQGGYKATLFVHTLHQGLKDRPFDRHQYICTVLPLRHQFVGELAKAGDIYKKRGGVKLTAQIARGELFDNKVWDQTMHHSAFS